MGISVYKIKKWTKMILGNSISHVNQGEGKIYSKEEVKGYYNDLTEKVTKRENIGSEVPLSSVDTGEKINFSIEIFQYGLGAYDLYLLNDDKSMIEKVKASADWAVNNQNEDGSWVTFAYEQPNHPYSSMAQGEGISLLLRAHILLKDDRYLHSAKKAFMFMIKQLEEGGTTKYDGNDIYFYECTEDPLILNGWIFSIWGVYDYHKFFRDENSRGILFRTLNSLEKKLADFDLGYWSKYEDGKRICSPFYHRLHVSQLSVMFMLFEKETYKYYAEKWNKYEKNTLYKIRAFVIKAIQKIME